MKSSTRPLALPGFELADKITEAVDFLRTNEPAEGYFVGFSGGKDSIVTLELCRMAGVKHEAYYSCTRIDPPEMYRFIKLHYPEVTWLFPKMTMWEGIQKYEPPLRIMRWCCNVLKKDPSSHIHFPHRVMGIRAEESTRRASRPRIDPYKRKQKTMYKPIFAWPEWAVWEFIEFCRLPYPSLYDEGFGRIGCVVCPFILGMSRGKTQQRKLSMQKWPGIWKAYEYAVKRWHNTKKANGTIKPAYENETAEQYWRSYLLGFEDCEVETTPDTRLLELV